jgi:hypothetical protein
LTTAKTVAKVSVVSDTAGEKKSLAADPQVLTIPPVENDPTRRSHRWTPAPAVGAAGGFRSVAPHLDLPIAGLRPLGGEHERHVEVEGLDDPEAGEVLLVSNVGGSWPYGWNRSVV